MKKIEIKQMKGGFGQPLLEDLTKYFLSQNIFWDSVKKVFRLFSSLILKDSQAGSVDFHYQNYPQELACSFLQTIVHPLIVSGQIKIYVWDTLFGFVLKKTFPIAYEEITASFVFQDKYFLQAYNSTFPATIVMNYTADFVTFTEFVCPFSYIVSHTFFRGVLYVSDGYRIFSSLDGITYTLFYTFDLGTNPRLFVFSDKLFVSLQKPTTTNIYEDEQSLYRLNLYNKTFEKLSFVGSNLSFFPTNDFLYIFSNTANYLNIYTYDLNNFILVNSISISFFLPADFNPTIGASNYPFRFRFFPFNITKNYLYFTLDYPNGTKFASRGLYIFNTGNDSVFPLYDLDFEFHDFLNQCISLDSKDYFLKISLGASASKFLTIFEESTIFLSKPTFLETSIYRLPQALPRSVILRYSPLPANVKVSLLVAYDKNCYNTRVYETTPLIEDSVTGSIYAKYDFPSGLTKEAFAFKVVVAGLSGVIAQSVDDIQIKLIFEESGVETEDNYF